jgi:hypothetical protein
MCSVQNSVKHVPRIIILVAKTGNHPSLISLVEHFQIFPLRLKTT